MDSLLSGELPSAIVQSFAGRHRPEWPGDPEEGTITPDGETPGGGGGWNRATRNVDAWKVKKKRDSIENVLGGSGLILNDEERDIGIPEEGEGDKLLPENIEEREARRERIAKLALNGTSHTFHHPQFRTLLCCLLNGC